MRDLKEEVTDLVSSFASLKASLKLDEKKKSLKKLEAKSGVEGFWDDAETARHVMQQLGDTKKEIEEIEELEKTISALGEFAKEGELSEDLKPEISKAAKKLQEIEVKSFLSGVYDKNNAIVSIHAGQGGTEAMDWTSMLYRMYSRFFEKRGWKYEVLDMTSGEEAGIKSITMKVSGNLAYGYLRGEAGTHRLVRQSPFNADKLRQTSFALVEVLPELDKSHAADIEIDSEDLDWQFYRSSGAGGQNVNKVNTAVRLTHKPSGIVVTSQTQRQQLQNRESALGLLRAKLWVKKQEEEKQKVKSIKGEYRPASWGTQIRSYVLHPYKMVKDLRTNVESSNPDNVLDGGLDDFVEAELRL